MLAIDRSDPFVHLLGPCARASGGRLHVELLAYTGREALYVVVLIPWV